MEHNSANRQDMGFNNTYCITGCRYYHGTLLYSILLFLKLLKVLKMCGGTIHIMSLRNDVRAEALTKTPFQTLQVIVFSSAPRMGIKKALQLMEPCKEFFNNNFYSAFSICCRPVVEIALEVSRKVSPPQKISGWIWSGRATLPNQFLWNTDRPAYP